MADITDAMNFETTGSGRAVYHKDASIHYTDVQCTATRPDEKSLTINWSVTFTSRIGFGYRKLVWL